MSATDLKSNADAKFDNETSKLLDRVNNGISYHDESMEIGFLGDVSAKLEQEQAKQKFNKYKLPLIIGGLAVVIVGFLYVSQIINDKINSHGFLDSSHHVTKSKNPFSTLDPVADMNLLSYGRRVTGNYSIDNSPVPGVGVLVSSKNDQLILPDNDAMAKPTNVWYQNIIQLDDGDTKGPTAFQRVYTIPYLLDFIGPIPGIRVQVPKIDTVSDVIQLFFNHIYGITLGISPSNVATSPSQSMSHRYSIQNTAPLGVSLEFNEYPMTTSIVRGMPYVTMHYPITSMFSKDSSNSADAKYYPTIASQIDLLDKHTKIDQRSVDVDICNSESSNEKNKQVIVDHELQFTQLDSDFTWVAYFSQPVIIECIVINEEVYGTGKKKNQNGDNLRLLKEEHNTNTSSATSSKEADGSNTTANATTPAPAPVKPKKPEKQKARLMFQVVDVVDKAPSTSNAEDKGNGDDDILTVRMALLSNCTTGQTNPSHCEKNKKGEDFSTYSSMLRKYSNIYPGSNTDVTYEINDSKNIASLKFDWDTHDMRPTKLKKDKAEFSNDLLMYALPHHVDNFQKYSSKSKTAMLGKDHCQPSLRGYTCLVTSSPSTSTETEDDNTDPWQIFEELSPISFRAQRPPKVSALYEIAKALKADINYTLPAKYELGASDTYFSGKMLSKLGRILIIVEELIELCNNNKAYSNVCKSIEKDGLLITQTEFNDALSYLRKSVEIWFNGKGYTPYIYDKTWGGVISCGCIESNYTETKKWCNNTYPECPSFYDPGMNFGNGYYNDHHFHYGYHIYASAVVAYFDNGWGKKYWDDVLLYIRDIANPSSDDRYFTTFRHKDWYMGNSWASGITSIAYLNGKNQESTTESIAAYEGVALYGKVMSNIWALDNNKEKMITSNEIRDVGRLLTTTEVEAANWYWHVHRSEDAERPNIYPSEYNHSVIGVLWSTRAQFHTWFGDQEFFSYGIQLMPITAISEQVYERKWSEEAYGPLAQSCINDQSCTDDGWTPLVYSMLATLGHVDEAIEKTLSSIPPWTLEYTGGGNGHSLSNTLWYIATRPEPDTIHNPPFDVPDIVYHNVTVDPGRYNATVPVVDCGCPETCTKEALEADALGFSCYDRISWIVWGWGYNEERACRYIAGISYGDYCHPCDPQFCGHV